MSSTKWCLKCKKGLGGVSTSLDVFGIGTSSGLYCKNSKCERYGLVTVLFLEEEKSAPKNVKSNNPVEESK
jgi:hypothetical protein